MGAIFGTSNKVPKDELKAANIVVEEVGAPQVPSSVRGLLSPKGSGCKNQVAPFDPSSPQQVLLKVTNPSTGNNFYKGGASVTSSAQFSLQNSQTQSENLSKKSKKLKSTN